ncbi:response regulator transcription factor [Streptomyces sp. NPDC005728]|uniref:response regulator transcription factor n=1 Tax=Streptomyces sp. NPDC005728 TaxID=3157054 RepID=UPI003401F65A
MPIRVMIVDDQALIRAGLRALVTTSTDFEVVAEADNGARMVSLARERAADVVLMKLDMPQADAVEATRQLVRQPGAPRVLLLTASPTDEVVLGALESGASGLLHQDVWPQELFCAIRSVAAGMWVMAEEAAARLLARSVLGTRGDMDGLLGRLSALSTSEREVLALLGAGHTNPRIAETLGLSSASVKRRVSRVLSRLGLDNRTQAAVFACEAGLAARAARVPTPDVALVRP